MSRETPPPYCLSRQHPELANRSPGPRGPILSRPNSPPAAAASPANASENASGKGL
jgi:hypothetical protein